VQQRTSVSSLLFSLKLVVVVPLGDDAACTSAGVGGASKKFQFSFDISFHKNVNYIMQNKIKK